MSTALSKVQLIISHFSSYCHVADEHHFLEIAIDKAETRKVFVAG